MWGWSLDQGLDGKECHCFDNVFEELLIFANNLLLFLMMTMRRVMFTSIVRESMKCPPWQRFRLSSPMNQSGEGTSFVTRETWDHFGDEILIYGNWSPTGRPLILSDCVICADYNVKTMFVTNGFTGRVEYNGGRRKTTLYNTATAPLPPPP